MRRRFRFYGCVQGVGFRWRALHSADLNGVTGYVRNLSDGCVEMEAEGSAEAIEKTVEAIGRGSFIHIERVEVCDIPEIGDRCFTAE